jgi:predicted dehydrogenase
MRWALLGDHPDGLEAARALAASGRHDIVLYSGPAAGADYLARDGLKPQRLADIEEALADPQVEAVIVAGSLSSRAAQLRRALQSEHHVLCVHPVDPSADVAYEAAMLQSDVRRVLLPLLPDALHPGIQRLAEMARVQRGAAVPSPDEMLTPLPPDFPRLLEWERSATEHLLLDDGRDGPSPNLPGWDVLRLLGGEIAEVMALGRPDELIPGEPLLITGRFLAGTLLQATWLPHQPHAFWRVTLVSGQGRAELTFPDGWPGPASLRYRDAEGMPREENWPALNPWPALVETFEAAVTAWREQRQAPLPGTVENVCLTQTGGRLGWLDAIRALELDDATRRSLQRRRASSLDFPEATEEAGFKGTMTLVGCGLLWVSLLLLIFSIWFPMLGLAILPIFGLFLVMQFLGWAVPRKEEPAAKPPQG